MPVDVFCCLLTTRVHENVFTFFFMFQKMRFEKVSFHLTCQKVISKTLVFSPV